MRTPQCMNGHERVEMLQDHVHKKWFCDKCELTLAPERIKLALDPIDEILGWVGVEALPVLLAPNEVMIEYPR